MMGDRKLGLFWEFGSLILYQPVARQHMQGLKKRRPVWGLGSGLS